MTFAWVWSGQLNRNFHFSNIFFSGAEVTNNIVSNHADNYKHVFRRDGYIKRKKYSICERFAYDKNVFLKVCMKSRDWLNIDFRL